MSIHINVGDMNYNQMSCAQRAEIDKKRKNRLAQVRQQSKEIAQHIRVKVQCEKKNQLNKLHEIRKREIEECRRRQRNQMEKEYESCLENFGAAHIAACEASCEEDEALFQKREENDLMAAQRGRSAMLSEQRKRDRAAEERLVQKKRRNQKNASVQADLVSRKNFGANYNSQHHIEIESENVSEEEDENVRVQTFTNKRNPHKTSTSIYNPQNFTSNSVESSNNYESEDIETSSERESDEFNQITNLLKQNIYERDQKNSDGLSDDPIELSDSSEEKEPPKRQNFKNPSHKVIQKKSILKKVRSPIKTLTKSSNKIVHAQDDKRVKYVDLANKFTTSYIPKDNLVTESQDSGTNARAEANRLNKAVLHGVSSDVLRQLSEIRSKEAFEKEKTRRDYERLRVELDKVARQEKAAEEEAGEKLRNISSTLLEKHEKSRKARLEQAAENAMTRNVRTRPIDKASSINSREVKIANSINQFTSSTSASSVGVQEMKKNPSKTSDEIHNIIKVEKLKDLLERINHQKKLLMSEIEKSDDVPSRDLDNVVKCLEKLEKEKAALNVQSNKQKEIEDLVAREAKIQEREKRFESRIREMFKNQKAFLEAADEKQKEKVSEVPEKAVVAPPVEIIIKVHQKSPRSSKFRKSFRCVDTLNRQPGKAYPKTPRKVNRSLQRDEDLPSEPEALPKPVQVPQETQTSPVIFEPAPKPILKKNQPKSVSSTKVTQSSTKPEDSSQSISTSYQSLPEKISVVQAPTADSRKNHHKLNPVLMHYITRLLGMNKNIENQLSVNVSPVATPGSSTINSSGNNGSITDAQAPIFDQKRLARLQEFINENYSFLSEVNETLERSELQEENEESILKVDGVWRDVLRNKKPQTATSKSTNKSDGKTLKQQGSVTNFQPKPAPNFSRPAPLQSSMPLKLTRVPQPATTQQQLRQKPVQQTAERPQTASSTRPQITSRDMLNVTKYLESHMLNNFAEYTANCQKRISDLAQMMERVRLEKQKLIENSLSSGEFGHFTEYREIAVPGTTQDNPTTTTASDLKDSPSLREDPPSEEINNILHKQTRPFGVSKDSGISLLSRPVTSSDFRESPDVRQNTSEEPENTFQPILRDIPKPPQRVRTAQTESGVTEAIKDLPQVLKDQEDKTAQRKQKPPLSLNRFSPNLEKPHEAHELSTIVEVETPTASKVNLLDKLQKVGPDDLASFPGFEDYAKNLETSEHSEEPKEPSFLNLGAINQILDEIKLQSFVKPHEYGIQELSSMHENASETESEASSLIDIALELQRRKIITKPFEREIVDKNVTPLMNKSQYATQPKSPQRRPAQSRIIIRTPDKMEIDIQTTPTKKRPFCEPAPLPQSPKSNDTLSGIQEIEKETRDDLAGDLQGMGLNWATSMFKRDNESKKLESSSSSTSLEKGQSIQIEIDVGKSSTSSSSNQSSSTGQPLNLREFLQRELAKKSRTDKSFSDESSLSSQFMRSLLNANSGNTSTSSKSGSTNDRLRTSTPLQTRVSSLVTQRTGNTNMFAGESLSTLKGSEADGSGKSDKPNSEDQRTSN